MIQESPVPSPCVHVCALDEQDICTACQRSVAEIFATLRLVAGLEQATGGSLFIEQHDAGAVPARNNGGGHASRSGEHPPPVDHARLSGPKAWALGRIKPDQPRGWRSALRLGSCRPRRPGKTREWRTC